ncbi:MAG: ABC transporter substrate-binding protein [Chloroflexota bacterium]|nr:ABC transporter substrate-binding protein [Chloroflexota bacterium]
MAKTHLPYTKQVARTPITRRGVVQLGTGAAGAAALGGRLAPSAAGQDGGSIVFLSTQLRPVNEAEAFRNVVLADFEGQVEFLPEDIGPFNDRLIAEAEAGQGEVGIVGGQHGDFASLVERELLMDLSDLAGELADRGLVEDYLELGRFGGEEQLYIPWMQATYIMAANREALAFLPEGLDETTLQTELTYEQLGAWVTAINEDQGPRFGLPAGQDGLLHRFLQGYAYPSFTGGVNTTFVSDEAVAMWEWLRATWAVTNPQSTGYAFMQEPLLAREVMVAWDHTARLINALQTSPDDFVTFPAPRGPAGLGFLPVVAGLAIPRTAPDPEASLALIEYLTRPETQALTLQEVAFFPAIAAELPTELDPGIQAEADAVAATATDPNALPSLLPVGLGDQAEAYNKVFRDAFQRIILDEEEIEAVLADEGANLQAALDAAEAACWAPDPASDGTCQVG